MPKFLVKNKYTYDRRPQTDYYYSENYAPISKSMRGICSHNYIPALFRVDTARDIGRFSFSKKDPAVIMLDKELKTLLKKVTGFRLSGASASDGAVIRASFFGKNSESYASACEARFAAGEGICFSTGGIGFEPEKLVLETDGDSLSCGFELVYVKNTLSEFPGQAHFYEASDGAEIYDRCCSVVLKLSGKGFLEAKDLPLDQGTAYGMKMPLRNTVFAVIRNLCGARTASLSFTSETSPMYSAENRVTLELAKDAGPHPYYFNLSACPGCDGRLTGFRLESDGEGELVIDSYSFEQEKPFYTVYSNVNECVADPRSDTFSVKASFSEDIPDELFEKLVSRCGGGCIGLFAGTMADDTGFGTGSETVAGKKALGSIPFPENAKKGDSFEFKGVPLRDDKTTMLPYQLLLFALPKEEGVEEPVCLTDRFYIENYECFDTNPYRFDVPERSFDVTDFGAKGDAMTDDTEAIQRAVDTAAGQGGGIVVIPGDGSFYGKRYIVTNILLRSNIELKIEEGAVLWQSQRREHYTYEPAYGHDDIIPGINWTHNLHTANLPLIQAANAENIKITGGGIIRMLDTGSEENVGMPGYSVGCFRRIHCIPLGLFLCKNVEMRDVSIQRSNNYHTSFNHCENVYIANVKLHRVKCVSGDGFGVCGVKHAFVNRCFFQSNDDAIVMSTHYEDPRGLLWWTNTRGEDNSVRFVTVRHSYLNSGGGKAICFITWGTSDPNQELEEISNVIAEDNVLTCVNPVGAWFDNPYNGKQPFDNTETDDYSPVKQIRIFGNRYVGICSLGPIQATDVLTDCGIISAGNFRNGDFSLGGLANWTINRNPDPDSAHTVTYCDKTKGIIEHFDKGEVSLLQGLHLGMGSHRFSCEAFTGPNGAKMAVEVIQTGEIIAEKIVKNEYPRLEELHFEITEAEGLDVYVGIASNGSGKDDFCVFDFCNIKSVTDDEGRKRALEQKLNEKVSLDFDLPEGAHANAEDGKVNIAVNATGCEKALKAKASKRDLGLECAVRIDRLPAGDDSGYAFRFSENGNGFRELRVNLPKRLLVIREVSGGAEKELFRKEDFFFTSLDFHNFRLEVSGGAATLWIDSGLYTSVKMTPMEGTASIRINNLEASLNGISIEGN